MRRAAFIGLLVGTSLACAQRPTAADAAALIERSRAQALAYTRSLPDFLCTESIRRFNRVATMRNSTWLLADRLTVKLSFFQQKEDHKLLTVNGQPTDQDFLKLGGAIGEGEFGGTLLTIFDPASQAAFQWQGWKTVRRHRAAVFTYSVEQAHSSYLLASRVKDHVEKAFVAFHGDLEIDTATGEVLHFTYLADHVPGALKLEKVLTTVDYDFADVGGQRYLLPARSETTLEATVNVRNEIEFRDYRKFATDSIIDFGPGK